MIVRESISFKRDIGSKRAMGIGRFAGWDEFIGLYQSENFDTPRSKVRTLGDKLADILINRGHYDLRGNHPGEWVDERLSWDSYGKYGNTMYRLIIRPDNYMDENILSKKDRKKIDYYKKLNTSSIWLSFEKNGDVFAEVEPYRSSESYYGPIEKLGNMHKNPYEIIDGIYNILDRGR